MSEAWQRLVRSRHGALGLILLFPVVLAVLAGPLLAPHNADAISFAARLHPPSARFWLGTDEFGRDILSRILVGARASVAVAVTATLLGTISGGLLGTLSAYLGGMADEAIMRTIDAMMAIPALLLALLVLSSLGKGMFDASLAIAIAFAPGMARITRSVALATRQQDYVNAAIARGESAGWIVLREMGPNVIAPLVVESTIRVAFAVMLVATLGFLGLGAQPPAPDWGLMIAEARQYLHQAPWMIVAPGAAIALTAVGFNLLGDGLRDALNPRVG
ncbi:MAG: ABC transporter permease [Rhodospirillales bacterium]|nr:ABC transporter permease [Rhodospirillales bacterium]